ncbi:MAG: hypothetical protein VKJ24_04860 [Synechococcales bacterium]|nr:hypothetical protein [Synechococcales bacterium]
MVMQWRQGELLAWAYEKLEVDNTPPKLPEPPESRKPNGGIAPIPKPIPGRATIVRYTPLPEINEGLHWNLSWEAQCDGTSCLFKPLPPLTVEPPKPPKFCLPGVSGVVVDEDGKVVGELPAQKDPSCVEAGSSGTESKPPAPKSSATPPQATSPARDVYRLIVYVGSQEFQLDGKDGIFPISASLAKALREATSSTVKIITPRKWEATINPEAVKNLSAIYQESGSSRTQR